MLNNDRVAAIVGRVLRLDRDDVNAGMSSLSVPAWDSIAHLNLVLEIESEFGVRFSAAEIPTLSSVQSICEALQRHLPSSPVG